ncbi:MAG: Hpt domain-containing protein [Bacteroidetes bacterium]|nr:Hpt domain-containing protein [Bacteroidota bacterium]
MQQIPMNASALPRFFVFNQQEFHAAIGDNDGLGKEILAIVLNELPTRIRNIQNGIKQSETGQLRREMHDLKGVVGLLGCSSLYQQISALKLGDQSIDQQQLLSLHSISERLKMLEKDLLLFSKMELPS